MEYLARKFINYIFASRQGSKVLGNRYTAAIIEVYNVYFFHTSIPIIIYSLLFF